MPTHQHVLRFCATIAGLEEAAGALRSVLDEQQVNADPRFKVELAFEEVVANIIKHGRPTEDVEVAIRFDDDEIVLTFEDDGVPFDPLSRPDPVAPSSIDEAVVGGLGLVLVKNMTTRLDYERTPRHRNLLTLALPAR